MVNATKAGKKWTRVDSKKRSDFESLLDSTLKKNFLKRNLNADVAKIAAENLLKDHPEYETCLGLVKFGESYFQDFFERYGWKWGIVRGDKTYIPAETLRKEIERSGKLKFQKL